MDYLGDFCSWVIMPSIGAGLFHGCLIYYILRKDTEFEEAILRGFMGEFPSDKVLLINYPSGERGYIESSRVNEAIRKNNRR